MGIRLKTAFDAAHEDISLKNLDIIEMYTTANMPLINLLPKNIPLSERDVVEIQSGVTDGILPEVWESRAVNFQFVLEKGLIPGFSDLEKNEGQIVQAEGNETLDKAKGLDLSVDFRADDQFNAALDLTEKFCKIRIDSNPELIALMDKSSWDREDRVVWEREVSKIVSDEMNRITGFDEYRTESKSETAVRSSNMNDISLDIDVSDPQLIEFDCEHMAVAEGIVLQRLENSLLPEKAPEDDYKVGSNYFYLVGKVNYGVNHFSVGGHAFIMSSATGNIIEATSDPDEHSLDSTYAENSDPDFSFEKFVKEGLAVNSDASIYGSYKISDGEFALQRLDAGQIKLTGLYSRVDALWAFGDRYDVNNGQPLHDDNTPIKEGSGIITIPPEIQALAVIKAGTPEPSSVNVQSCHENTPVDVKERFDQQVDAMVADGSIYEALKFLNEIGALSVSSDVVEIKGVEDDMVADASPATPDPINVARNDGPPAPVFNAGFD